MPLEISETFNSFKNNKTGSNIKFLAYISFSSLYYSSNYIDDGRFLTRDVTDFTLNIARSDPQQRSYANGSIIIDDQDNLFRDYLEAQTPYYATIYAFFGDTTTFRNAVIAEDDSVINKYGLKLLDGFVLTPVDINSSTGLITFDVQEREEPEIENVFPAVSVVHRVYNGESIVTGSSWWNEYDYIQIPRTYGNVRKTAAYPITNPEYGTCQTDWSALTAADFGTVESWSKEYCGYIAFLNQSDYTVDAVLPEIPSGFPLHYEYVHPDIASVEMTEATATGAAIAIGNDFADMMLEHRGAATLLYRFFVMTGHIVTNTDVNALFNDVVANYSSTTNVPYGDYFHDWYPYNESYARMYRGCMFCTRSSTTPDDYTDVFTLDAAGDALLQDYIDLLTSASDVYGGLRFAYDGYTIWSGQHITSGKVYIYDECNTNALEIILPSTDERSIFGTIITDGLAADQPQEIEIRKSDTPTRTYPVDNYSWTGGSDHLFTIDVGKPPSYVYCGGFKIGVVDTGVDGDYGGTIYNVTSCDQVLATQKNLAKGTKCYHEDRKVVCAISDYPLRWLKYYMYNSSTGVRSLSTVPKETGFLQWLTDNLLVGYETVSAVSLDKWLLEQNNTEQWEPTVYVDATYPEVSTYDAEFAYTGDGYTYPDSSMPYQDGTLVPSNIPQLINYMDWYNDVYCLLENGKRVVGISSLMYGTYNWYHYDWYRDQSFYTIQRGDSIVSHIGPIAFQGMLATWRRGRRSMYKYLGKEPWFDKFYHDDRSNIVIDYSTILEQPVISCNASEDISTRFVFKWKEDLLPDVDSNEVDIDIGDVRTRGTLPKTSTFDLYAVHTKGAAQRLSSFWSLRLGCRYTTVRVTVPLSLFVNIDLMDVIQLDLPDHLWGSTNIKGEVTSLSMDTANRTIDLEISTPILFGTGETFKWYWPIGIGDEDDYVNYWRGTESDAAYV